MAIFLGLLSFVTLIAMIVGLIKPSWLKLATRGKVLLWYGLASVLLLIIGVATTPQPAAQSGTTSSGSQPAQEAVAPKAAQTVVAPHPAKAAAPKPMPPVQTPAPEAAPALQPAPSEPQVVLDISGSGTKSTDIFTVGNNWHITWSYDCSNFGDRGNFQIYINTADGSPSFENSGTNQLGASGVDTDYYHAGGSYYLDINSECNWSVTVRG